MDWIVQTRAADGPWVRGMGTPRSDGPHEPYHCRAGGPDKRERRGLLVATHRNEILVPNRNASIAFGSCTTGVHMMGRATVLEYVVMAGSLITGLCMVISLIAVWRMKTRRFPQRDLSSQ
jgi:hypothetical protein